MDEVKSWFDLAMSVGPLWVVFGLLTFFMVKYVPQLVSKHMELVNTLCTTQASICTTQAEIVSALHGLMKKQEASDG